MDSLPFDRPGRFYRGNLHTHSTLSDGRLGLAETVRLYADHGYDVVAMSEHFDEPYGWPIADTRALRGERFTTLIGAELHAPALENGVRWHLLAAGLPLDFAPNRAGESGPELAARARAAGAFVAMAHPYWYNQTLADALTLVESVHAVETWNYGCAVEVDRGDSWYLSDMLSGLGHRLSGCATDDAHCQSADYRGGWVQVRATALDPDALVAALKSGHYYSSSGPELRDVRVDGERLRVACSPAATIALTGRRSRSAFLTGLDGATEAELPLDKFRGEWCRLTVVDGQGRRAWTNPIWLDGGG
jgi:predicted metal-dependent phosphoesterase TrpH